MILKKFKNIVIVIIVALAFQACIKNSQNVIGKNNLYKTGLEYTQVNDLVYSFETKAILNTTYLNISDPSKYDNPNENSFLIGIYIVNDNEKKEKKALNNKKFILSLNSNTEYTKQLINKSDEIYENIPVLNPYAQYYMVKFKKDKSKIINIKYSHTNFGSITSKYESF